ncbi:MAG TPA: response regulator [Candidatus Methylomirabilis sp.]
MTKKTNSSDGGTILVVDDQRLVCEGIRGMLEATGFAVLTAESGRTGVTLFRRQASAIRAVLLDLRLPGENASEVFDAMRHLRPDVPIILITGTPEAIARQELARPGLSGFLQKPFDVATAIRIIRETLQKAPPARDTEGSSAG